MIIVEPFYKNFIALSDSYSHSQISFPSLKSLGVSFPYLTSSRFETNFFKESPYFEDSGQAPMLCNAGCGICQLSRG